MGKTLLKIKGPDGKDIEIKSMAEAMDQIGRQIGSNISYNQLEGQIVNHYRGALFEYGKNGGSLRDVDLPQDSSLLLAGVIDSAAHSPWNLPERDTILKLCDQSINTVGGERKDIAGNYVKNAWSDLLTYGPEHFSGDTIVQLMNIQAKKTKVDANGGSLQWNEGSKLLYQNKNVNQKISAEHLDKLGLVLRDKETPKEIKQYMIKMAYNSDLAKMSDFQRAELETLAADLMGKEYLETVDIYKLSRSQFAKNKKVNETLDTAIESGGDKSLAALDIVNDVRKNGANRDLQDKVSAASDRIAQCIARKKELHELAQNNMSTDMGVDLLANKEKRKESSSEWELYEQRKEQKDFVLNNNSENKKISPTLNKMKEQVER